MKALLPALLTLLLSVSAASGSYAATLTVTKTDDTNDGICDADCSLREAVLIAAAGDTVVFSALFNSTQTITLTLGEIVINKDLTITGPGPDLLSVSGNNTTRIFKVTGPASVSMSDMTLRNGWRTLQTDHLGGAIRASDCQLTISNMVFHSNLARYQPGLFENYGSGGAIYASASMLTITNSDMFGNSATAGGAVSTSGGGVSILNSRLTGNVNGAFHSINSHVDLRDSTFDANGHENPQPDKGWYPAVTIAGNNGNAAIVNCSASNNSHAGIYQSGGSVTIDSSTISGNMGRGGIITSGGSLTLKRTKVRNNVLTGLFGLNAFEAGAGLTLDNSETTVIDSDISYNLVELHSYPAAAGIMNRGILSLINSTVSNNAIDQFSPFESAAGLIAYDGRVLIVNSTIAENRCDGFTIGCGVVAVNHPIIFANSIIARNVGNSGELDVQGSVISQGNNLVGTTVGSAGWISSDILNTDPLIGPLSDNGGDTLTHALMSCSPAIDAGNSALAIDPITMMPLEGDQRGFPRFVGSSVDIGAYEYAGDVCITPTPTGTPTPAPTPQTLTVTKTADTNDGVCDSDCSLREAVLTAASGDTVVFSELFNTPQTITLSTGEMVISKDLTITGTGRNNVIVSANNASRIFQVFGGGHLSASGMTLRDGNVVSQNAFGGAILVRNSFLNLTDVLLMNNRAFHPTDPATGGAIYGISSSFSLHNISAIANTRGGAIVSETFGPGHIGGDVELIDSEIRENIGTGIRADTLVIRNSFITGNSGIGIEPYSLDISDSTISSNAGGIRSVDTSATHNIERCTISGNIANQTAGGIYVTGTTVIRDSRIVNNRGSNAGGGIDNSGELYVISSAIAGNTSNVTFTAYASGGGISNLAGKLWVVNSTISGNTALGDPGEGGGIYAKPGPQGQGSAFLINSTVANNTSRGRGAGVRIEPELPATFTNTIVSGNNSTLTASEDVSGAVISNGHNFIRNPSGSSGLGPTDIVNIDPLLGPLTDNGGDTLTHALMNCSPAIDTGNSALAIDPLTVMPLKGDQRGFSRFVGSSVDIGAYEYNGDVCITPTPTPSSSPTPTETPTATPTATPTPGVATSFDFDGDNKADISVYRPGEGNWYIQGSSAGFNGVNFGVASDRVVPADFDGDGKADISVYRPSTGVWYIINSSDGTISYHSFGLDEDLPTPADFDADGRADMSVFRPSTGTWYRINSNDGSFFAAQFGTNGDRPVIGDYDGDGKADTAVYRPSQGTWYWANSSDGSFHAEQFGIDTDVVSPGDYDGDGKTDLAVFRPLSGFWYIRSSETGSYNALQFGISEDIPAAADFDGDGKADIAVFRPSTGTWYRLNSSDSSFSAYQFGTAGDIPTQAAFRY